MITKKYKELDAKADYQTAKENIALQIAAIQTKLARHINNNTNINWGHVGSLCHVDSMLNDINMFLR